MLHHYSPQWMEEELLRLKTASYPFYHIALVKTDDKLEELRSEREELLAKLAQLDVDINVAQAGREGSVPEQE